MVLEVFLGDGLIPIDHSKINDNRYLKIYYRNKDNYYYPSAQI